MTTVVLDASALLALLRNEPGAERVLAALSGSAMSIVNFSEVIGNFARDGFAELDIRRALDPLPVEKIDFDEEQAYRAGLMISFTRPVGLSLGDRACLALAAQLAVKVLTADRAWLSTADRVGVEIELIRP